MRSAVSSWPTIPTINLSAPEGVVGDSYSMALEISGTKPITWSLESGNLPSGLRLNSSGEIIGAPTAEGKYTFTVKASNVLADVIKDMSITVEPVYKSGGGCNIAGIAAIAALAISMAVVFAKKRLK
jgi:hypothetical protein